MKNRQKYIYISESAQNEIINTVGACPAESGGLLFGYREDYIVRKFLFDKDAKTTNSTYTLNTDYLVPMMDKLWEEEGLKLLGILHSHPIGCKNLSSPDKKYFGNQFGGIPVDWFYTPIVNTIPDGGYRMFGHIFYKDIMDSEEAIIKIIPDAELDDCNVMEIKPAVIEVQKPSFKHAVKIWSTHIRKANKILQEFLATLFFILIIIILIIILHLLFKLMN